MRRIIVPLTVQRNGSYLLKRLTAELINYDIRIFLYCEKLKRYRLSGIGNRSRTFHELRGPLLNKNYSTMSTFLLYVVLMFIRENKANEYLHPLLPHALSLLAVVNLRPWSIARRKLTSVYIPTPVYGLLASHALPLLATVDLHRRSWLITRRELTSVYIPTLVYDLLPTRTLSLLAIQRRQISTTANSNNTYHTSRVSRP